MTDIGSITFGNSSRYITSDRYEQITCTTLLEKQIFQILFTCLVAPKLSLEVFLCQKFSAIR